MRTVRAEYLEALSSSDLSRLGELFSYFFRNSGCAGLVDFAYYSDIADGSTRKKMQFVSNVLRQYETWLDFMDETDIGNLSTPIAGNPWGYVIDGIVVSQTAPRHHYQATQVKSLFRTSSTRWWRK